MFERLHFRAILTIKYTHSNSQFHSVFQYCFSFVRHLLSFAFRNSHFAHISEKSEELMRIYCELNQTKMCAVGILCIVSGWIRVWVYVAEVSDTRRIHQSIKSYILLLNTWNAKSEK